MTTSFIAGFVSKIAQSYTYRDTILNAGSGGKVYPTKATFFHLDIAENTIRDLDNAFVGNIIEMPFSAHQFDCAICVGTVINYCEADKAIRELNRVLKLGGNLVLEYERSGSGFVIKDLRNTDSVLFHHTYYDEPHVNLLYSEKYIKSLVIRNGFEILKQCRFNTTLPLMEKLFSDASAHKLAFIEPILRHVPLLNRYSHNMILLCMKTDDVLLDKDNSPLPEIKVKEMTMKL